MRFLLLHSPSPRSGVDIFGGKKINLHLWVGWVEVRSRRVRAAQNPTYQTLVLGFTALNPTYGAICVNPHQR